MLLLKTRGPEFQSRVRHMILNTVCAVATIIFCGTASAQKDVTVPPMFSKRLASCTNADLTQKVLCADFQMSFRDGSGLVQRAFNSKEYDKLDKLYGQWCTGDDRFPNGQWKLPQYEEGLRTNFLAWNRWEKDLEMIKTWQTSSPKSEAAQYVEAVYWRAYAWKARGSTYTSSISEADWVLFRERLAKSKDILDTLRAASPQCPAPYPLILWTLTDLGASEDQFLAVYSEGARRFPEYHEIYFSMAKHYQPKWGGTIGKFDVFAKQVAAQTKKFEGMGMYARLYSLVDKVDDIPFSGRPSQPPTWKALNAGYEDIMQKYPSSMENLGKYVGVACRTSDSKLYRKLRSNIVGYEQFVSMADPVDICDTKHEWNSAVTRQ